ncbi:hypothetical protein EX30DRAFT_239090 [Ascodesmis nigricans]|uniref:glucan endo-1,3-beta-D-glucosidase n=1 Tax=Ascodesmis nigricans TaxID=341454 RepID=A0A4S2MZA2_9PEZI|nr:hypothetical protein EX30DRAFT_239090 [Ascodesmis nigricans]
MRCLSSAALMGIALSVLTSFAAASNNCQVLNGNTFCKEVNQILYENIGAGGLSYDDVVKMDKEGCVCKKEPKTYSGKMAPLDEQLSIHFRGPLALKQFAVYYPGGSPTKTKRHHHRHYARTTHGPHCKRSGYTRAAYYNADSGIAQGLVFMNHKGGDGSGVWDTCWGNSLAYSDSQCSKGVSTPEVLAPITVPSDTEFVIFSDQECDESCGTWRPGTPAHKGFDGKDKVFLFEFVMPSDGSGGNNGDMPSIWALNAKIPRTSQYSDCSCWGSGCGEFDMFEVLEGGKDFVKSHFHAAQGGTANKGGGGSPDFIARPYDKPVKAAVIFDGSGTVDIKMLDDDVDFGGVLDSRVLNLRHEAVSKFVVPS